MTLYGGSDETYARVTGDPKGLTKALENIRFFRSLGVPVRLSFTAVRQNILDYPGVAALCGELGLPYTLLTDITPHRMGAGYSKAPEWRLTPAERACVACCRPEDVAEAMEEAKELEKEAEGFRIPSAPEGLPPEADSCIGSLTGCAILWNGEMQSCISMGRYRSAKPFETGFEDAWARLKALEKETFLRPAECVACEMAGDCLHNCAGRRFEGTGSPQTVDPDICRYTYLLRLCRARRDPHDVPPPPPCT